MVSVLEFVQLVQQVLGGEQFDELLDEGQGQSLLVHLDDPPLHLLVRHFHGAQQDGWNEQESDVKFVLDPVRGTYEY